MSDIHVSTSTAAQAQPVLDVQDIPSTSCRICMADDLQQPAKIQACGHQFWYDTRFFTVQLSPVWCQALADPVFHIQLGVYQKVEQIKS